MGFTSKEFVDFLYNRKLPQVYRDEDSKIGYPLKRYLESLTQGGFDGALKDINNLMLLIDPKAIPEKFFPYLCESFGLEYFPDIDVTYQRKFLINVGELVKRRGTFSSVHYMIRALTGLEAELSLEGNTLNIVLLAATLEQMNNIEISMVIIGNYIQTQIPYYIIPNITSRISTQVIPSSSYTLSAMATHKHYQITQKEDR